MHIVLAAPFFANTVHEPLSGMPRYVYKIAGFLQEAGHDVQIVAGAINDRTWQYGNLRIHNVRWSGSLEGSAFAVSVGILQRECAIQKKLRQIDARKSVDIVQYAGWSGTGCLHSLKCPAVLRLSTYSKVQYAQNETMQDYIQVYSFWERMSGRRADGIIGPSRVLGEQFGKDIRRKVILMETPYDNHVAEDSTVYDELLHDKKYLLFYGTFSSDKGFQVISDMLPKLFSQNKELIFVCAGWNVKLETGYALQEMKRKLGRNRDRVLYLGAVKQQQLYPVIRHAEAVLIPSLIDNLPNACLEALSLHKIVIGTYGTSLEQLIVDGENGFLSEPGNADSLLTAVCRVNDLSDSRKKEMLQKSKQLIRKYSPEISVKKLERYYRWLIQKKAGGSDGN